MQVIVADEVGHLISGPEDDTRGSDDGADLEDELDAESKRRLLDNFTFLFRQGPKLTSELLVFITFCFRVAPGLCLNSHAAQCALLNGVPRRIVRRAQCVR